MLDCRSAALAIRERHPDLFVEPEEQRSSRSGRTSPNEAEGQPPPMAKLTSLSPASRKPSISLSEMITTSITLKSTLDLDIQGPNSGWPSGLFSESTASSSRSSLQPPSVSSQQPEGDQVPSRVAEAISALQREVLLLRTELNFELWISRENVKHFGRLYQDRILSKNAEAERQGLVRPFIYLYADGNRCDASTISTISYADTVDRSFDLNGNSGNTRNRRPLRRTNMLTGTRSCSKSCVTFEKKRNPGFRRLLLYEMLRRRPGYEP